MIWNERRYCCGEGVQERWTEVTEGVAFSEVTGSTGTVGGVNL